MHTHATATVFRPARPGRAGARRPRRCKPRLSRARRWWKTLHASVGVRLGRTGAKSNRRPAPQSGETPGNGEGRAPRTAATLAKIDGGHARQQEKREGAREARRRAEGPERSCERVLERPENERPSGKKASPRAAEERPRAETATAYRRTGAGHVLRRPALRAIVVALSWAALASSSRAHTVPGKDPGYPGCLTRRGQLCHGGRGGGGVPRDPGRIRRNARAPGGHEHQPRARRARGQPERRPERLTGDHPGASRW